MKSVDKDETRVQIGSARNLGVLMTKKGTDEDEIEYKIGTVKNL